MTLDLPTLLTLGALLVALVALAVALLAWRKADDARDRSHTHPRPQRMPMLVERREVDQGPPAGQPERRGRHAGDRDERARRRDRDDPRWQTRDGDSTGELPAAELPTTALPAQPGPVRLPPPGAIRGG
jgi:hypothetical protein